MTWHDHSSDEAKRRHVAARLRCALVQLYDTRAQLVRAEADDVAELLDEAIIAVAVRLDEGGM